ncbi:putative capsid [Beihai barnacle virus 12]|uniref:putative capsid n=1 Tax=Beihai barnacle virus 12 TaxID=1922356 RepID=UPI00090B5E0D|nr:putative capsid [Beihai barnacle virus 12]APG78178.1 putative capsid [Beihai barnacle virus 12]
MSSRQTQEDNQPDEPVPNPTEQKTRVFSNSGRRGKPKPQSKAGKPKVSAGPKAPPPAGPPKPQHLSGKGTSLANDPLWQEAFVLEGDKGYVQVPTKREFQVSAEGLHDIASAVYTEMSMVDGHFRKTIPESAFHYYTIVLLHARLAELGKRHPTDTTYEDFRFVELMKEYGPVPEPIEAYFRSIGDLPDVAGVEYKLKLPPKPLADRHGPSTGFHRRVSAETHNTWEQVPAPGVAAMRMCQDMAYTQHPNRDIGPIWDLPAELRPVPEHGHTPGRPTGNLLGWQPATLLSNEQRTSLSQCGVTPTEASTAGTYAVNLQVLGMVSSALARATSVYRCASAAVHNSANGSYAQATFCEVEDSDLGFQRRQQYTSAGLRSCTAFQADARISVASRNCCFRVKRKTGADGTNRWACYDYDQYRTVPPSWTENMNATFNAGEASAELNITKLATAYADKSRTLRPWARAPVINKSRD